MKRFYKQVDVARAQSGGWQITLDGRLVKTQGGAQQSVPSKQLVNAMAKEWDNQSEELDPKAFILRDLTDYALDIVAPDPTKTISTLATYAETDTLCYRGDPDDAVFARQDSEWEPILASIEAREDVRFTRISGIIHKAQPAETVAKLRALMTALDPFALAGLQTFSSLATSLCIGLEALQSDADAQSLWHAANLEELWQEELWGVDPEAKERRDARGREFVAAFDWLQLARAQ